MGTITTVAGRFGAIVQPATLTARPRLLGQGTAYPQFWPPEIFAAQPDPTDPARSTLPTSFFGGRRIWKIHLLDDDTIEFDDGSGTTQ